MLYILISVVIIINSNGNIKFHKAKAYKKSNEDLGLKKQTVFGKENSNFPFWPFNMN